MIALLVACITPPVYDVVCTDDQGQITYSARCEAGSTFTPDLRSDLYTLVCLQNVGATNWRTTRYTVESGSCSVREHGSDIPEVFPPPTAFHAEPGPFHLEPHP